MGIIYDLLIKNLNITLPFSDLAGKLTQNYPVLAVVLGVLFIGVAFFLWNTLKNLTINLVLGILGLVMAVNFFHLDIPINIATFLISAIFGLAGVGSLIIMNFFNLI